MSPAPSTRQRLLPVATGAQIRRYARRVLTTRWPPVAAAAVTVVCQSVLALAGPVAIGWVAQAVVDRRGAAAIAGPVILLAVAATASALIAWAASVLLARAVLPPVAQLREDAVSAALGLPLAAVESGGSGDLVARVSGDADRISATAQGALGHFVAASATILVTLAGLAALDWRFALAGLVAVPIQAHTLRWYLRRSRPIYAAGRVAEGERAAVLLNTFVALPTLRALRQGPRHQERIEAASAHAMGFEFRVMRAATRFFGRLNLAEFVGLGAVLAVAYVLVDRGAVTVGAATTAALFFAGLFNPINVVLAVFDELQQAGAALARLLGVVSARVPHTASAAAPAPTPVPPLDLAAGSVTFGYGDGEGPDVLHDVSLRIGPAEHVAVVGATGSGKSTLAALLAGIRQPREGGVTLGGIPLTYADPADLRRHVALITQETHVFAGTVADNLRIVAPHAAESGLDGALAAVGALGWVRSLPGGMHTPVGAGGLPLTTSQAQHLALARVLLLDPAIVILDEATAEAGSDAARVLDAAAERAIAGRGALIIAHRLSQAARADRIAMLDGGVIIEQGSHDELLAAGGAYANLWTAWSGRSHPAPPSRLRT